MPGLDALITRQISRGRIWFTRLAGDPQAAMEFGRKGRRFVEAELDRDKLAAQMLEELRSVAAA